MTRRLKTSRILFFGIPHDPQNVEQALKDLKSEYPQLISQDHEPPVRRPISACVTEMSLADFDGKGVRYNGKVVQLSCYGSDDILGWQILCNSHHFCALGRGNQLIIELSRPKSGQQRVADVFSLKR